MKHSNTKNSINESFDGCVNLNTPEVDFGKSPISSLVQRIKL